MLDIPFLLDQIEQEMQKDELMFEEWLQFMDQEITETQLIWGDINSDGIIDILDIVCVINIIMN